MYIYIKHLYKPIYLQQINWVTISYPQHQQPSPGGAAARLFVSALPALDAAAVEARWSRGEGFNLGGAPGKRQHSWCMLMPKEVLDLSV